MRKRIGLLKKGVAAVLTACMVAGIIPVMPEATVEVQAAITAPTATIAYATKKELMTIFDIDGTQDTVGKIVFGKNQNGNEQEWYIAGEDKRIAGENVVLFAADYLIEKEKFCLDYKDRSYDPGWGCSYLTAPKTVYANHYGGSNLRMILDTMTAKGTTTYFTEAEKNLMNKTTIETRDAMNSTMYATTGKLYLPASDRLTWADMWVGSEDSIAIGTQYLVKIR